MKPRQIFAGTIRRGFFNSIARTRMITIAFWIITLSLTLYGGIGYGWRGAGTGFLIALMTGHMAFFLAGVGRRPLAGAATFVGRLQRILAGCMIPIMILSAWWGGWQSGWLYILYGYGVYVVLVYVVVFLARLWTAPAENNMDIQLLDAYRQRKAKNETQPDTSELQILNKLLDACEENLFTLQVLIKTETDRRALRELYFFLLNNNGGLQIAGRFLPAASLLNYATLEFVIQNRSKSPDYIIKSLVDFFQGAPIVLIRASYDGNIDLPRLSSQELRSLNDKLQSVISILKNEDKKNARNEDDNDRVNEYEDAVTKLLDLVFEYREAFKVIQKYQATRSQLVALFENLRKKGANVDVGGNYVAAAAIIHPETLDFLLSLPADANAYEYARQVINFFDGYPLIAGSSITKKKERSDMSRTTVLDIFSLKRSLSLGNSQKIVDELEGKIDIDSTETDDDLLFLLASAYNLQQRYLEAERVMLSAIESSEYLSHVLQSAPSIVRGDKLNQVNWCRDKYTLAVSRIGLMDYENAQKDLREALAGLLSIRPTPLVVEEIQVQRQELITFVLDLMGDTYKHLGEGGMAEVIYGGAYHQRLGYYGNNHPETAKSLQKLGQLKLELADYDTAEEMLTTAEKIFNDSKLTNHPDFARILFSLAQLHYERNHTSEAEKYYRMFFDGKLPVFDADATLFVPALSSYASLYLPVKGFKEAFVMLDRARVALDASIRQAIIASSGANRFQVLRVCRNYLDMIASVAIASKDTFPDGVVQLLQALCHYKGIGVDTSVRQRMMSSAQGNRGMLETLNSLRDVRNTIAAIMLQQTHTGTLKESNRLVRLERLSQALERKLSRFSFSELAEEPPVVADIVGKLSSAIEPGWIFIDYFQYGQFDGEKTGSLGWKLGHQRYAAITLTGGDPDSLTLTDLGDVATIDKNISVYRSGITGRIEEWSVGLQEGGEWLMEFPTTFEMGVLLRQQLLDALHLGHHEGLLISSDGNLARLPFISLPDKDGKPLVLSERINYRASARDILKQRSITGTVARTPLVAGAPDYWRSLGSVPNEEMKDIFKPLPGTLAEAEVIGKLLRVEPVVGKAFTKKVLRECMSPLILHIATHGYFLPLNKNSNGDGTRASASANESTFSRMARSVSNPLLRSGVTLAGVNAWLNELETDEDTANGIMSAEEASMLNLEGTEITVLSACETGLGDTTVGEGVIGLSQAFIQAGSRTVITSLWAVPDKQTSRLMELFYTNLIHEMDRVDALHEAQKEMCKSGAEARSWAAFLVFGENGPVRLEAV